MGIILLHISLQSRVIQLIYILVCVCAFVAIGQQYVFSYINAL